MTVLNTLIVLLARVSSALENEYINAIYGTSNVRCCLKTWQDYRVCVEYAELSCNLENTFQSPARAGGVKTKSSPSGMHKNRFMKKRPL